MTPFNLWLMKELEAFFHLLTVIKTSLQSIKHAVDVNALGNALTPEQLSVADDLYFQRIPELWRQHSGPATPPPLQTLTTFINDIVARSTHFERILVLVSKLTCSNYCYYYVTSVLRVVIPYLLLLPGP